MVDNLKEILEKPDERIKSFGDCELSRTDIEWIKDELKNYPQVHRIKWQKNEQILDQNKDLKVEIDKQLLKNIIKTSQFVINLTEIELDQSLLKWLENKIENNPHICGIIWGEKNERLIRNNKKQTERFNQLLWSNNIDFEKFPTDYTHCLMTSHCQNEDKSVWAKLENKKWIIEDRWQRNGFSAMLYRNDARRQFVLAFQGLKLQVRDIFVEDSKLKAAVYDTLTTNISDLTYYTYHYTRAAFELSQELGYNLSLTGYSFGAWLAEQGVFFCYKEFGSLNVRAVTFESPGSCEIIQELAQTNILGNDLDPSVLDIRTYLMSPNFINTSNTHIGRIYQLFEKSFFDKYLNSIDDFISKKIIGSIENKRIKDRIEKWYNQAKNFLRKYMYYLNGLTSLLSDNLNWIIEFFEREATGDKIFKVISWPKMDIDLKKNQLDEVKLNIVEDLMDGVQLPKFLKKCISKPIDSLINYGIKSIGKKYFSTISLLINIISAIANGDISAEQCMECYSEGPLEYKETEICNEASFRIAYKGKYHIEKVDLFKDTLTLNLSHIDKRLDDIYYDLDDKYVNSRIAKQFENLKNSFEIIKKWNRYELIGSIESKNGEFVIDNIREICIRLLMINEFYPSKTTAIVSKKEHEIIDYFGGIRMENYVKTDSNIYEIIDRMLQNNNYVYIYGQSGFGKTTLARQFGYYKKGISENSLIQFVVSSDYNSNLYTLQKLFNCLDVNTDPLGALKSKIISLNKDVLFIFDNVEKLDDVWEILENFTNSRFRFLLTTTDKKLFQKFDSKNKHGHEIKPFDLKCCFEYLRVNGVELKSDEEKNEWRELIREASDNTMFLSPKNFELAVRYYTNRDSFEYNKLLKILLNRGNSRYEILLKENKKAYKILVHLAFLDGDFIDLNIIKRLFTDIDFDEPLKYLVKNGYLKQHFNEQNKVLFEMHQSIQDEIKKIFELDQDGKNEILARINYVLNNAIPNKAVDLQEEDREKLDKLNKHSRKLLKEKWKNRNKDENFREFLSKIVEINIITSNLEYSKNIENEILAIKTSLKNSKENNLSIACSYESLAEISKNQEKYKDSLKNYLKMYDILIETLPLEHPLILTTMNNIGNVLRKLGRLAKSIAYYKNVLKALKKTLPKNQDNHPLIAEAYNNIGLVYKSSQNYDEALRIFSKSLNMREISLPPNHEDIFQSKINIGITYKTMENYKDALRYFKDCIKNIDKESLESNYSQIDQSLNYIAVIYKNQGNYEKALKIYEKLLEIRKEKYGENNHRVAEVLNKIGYTFYKQGKYDLVLEYLKKALKMLEETMLFSADVAKLYSYIGLVYYIQEKHTKALEAYKKALEISKQVYAKSNHPSLVILSNNIQKIESKI